MSPGFRALLCLAACALTLLALAPAVFGDEGMWLFNKPPRDYLKKRYDFPAEQKWLDHVQMSSVRFNTGGSGSFVSADGLVLTNHHVGADTLEKMRDADHNYLRDGFYARKRSEEKKNNVGLDLNVLMKITDVTARVGAAVKPDMKAEEAFAARRRVMGEIEQEALKESGLRSDVVTLYNGGLYHLYQYKVYTDVRLVFAPEQQIAFYGGDPDNFEYPRFDLDVCVFRAYENDEPVHPEHYLKWSKAGAAENELVFVSGCPARTDRLATVAELEYLRDVGYPFALQRLFRSEVTIGAVYGRRSAENARRARESLLRVENNRKRTLGALAGLLDPEIMARKKADEKAFRDAVDGDEKLKSARDAWDRIAGAQKARAEIIRRYALLEGEGGFNSSLFGHARVLVRAADELPKKSGERLREFGDSRLAPLKLRLFSRAPIYDDFEKVKLTDSLTFLANELGGADPLVRKVLDGKSPEARACELVEGTKLKSAEERKKLFEGGQAAVETAGDPMLALARLVDPEARALRKRLENEVDEATRRADSDLADARFALHGADSYPDATFSPRLSFGTVKGYEEDGKKVPFETTFAGLYDRAARNDDKEPFDLPAAWVERKDKLDLATPFNFVCTADIIGGNSGSPVINRDAELVGVIFDGNIQSLVWDFAYDDARARAVAVHSQGILEALRKVYDADALADELTGKKP